MSDTLIASLITGCVGILVCIINNSTTKSLITYKLEELTKRVDKHNSVIERTYALEQRTEIQEEKIKVANNRIKDLEGRKS